MTATYNTDTSGRLDWAPADSSQNNSTTRPSSFKLQAKKTMLETIYDQEGDDADGKIVPLVTAA